MKHPVLLLIIVLLVGCADDKDANPVVPEGEVNAGCREAGAACKIMPLAVGNHWLMERIVYDTVGQEVSRDTTLNVVERDTVIGSETWYFISPVWYANRSDGVWYKGSGHIDGLLFKYPAQVGDSFTCDVCSFYHVVTSIDTTLSIDLGSFYCYEYTTVFDWADTSYSYVAPGIGPIKSLAHYQKTDSTVYLGSVSTLIDYKLE
jgi:hypothetical protein